LAGSYRALCNHSLLSPEERNRVDAAERQDNLRTCLSGLYPFLCDRGLLATTENKQVPTAVDSTSQSDKGSSASPQASSSVQPAASSSSTTSISLPCAENGSCYGDPNANGVPKTVHVNGYYRKDGTYVRGHYRSAPGTNPPRSHR
jgi:hypothetical protein